MNFAAVMLAVLAICALLAIAVVVLFFLGLRRLWRRTGPDQVVRRRLILAFGLLAIVAPYVASKIAERNHVLSRVPEPLEVAEIEYRLEELFGVGFMPGDNETGFVVYRLTEDSADWARKQGSRLGDRLPGAKGVWRATPVEDRSDEATVSLWHHYDDRPQMMDAERPERHLASLEEYLEKYGFSIPIEKGRTDEANKAIQSGGSFYSYGKGGSVTVVDPARGKVYFAYAG
ncbi:MULTISPECIES: hypothetical protein [unclassified Ensifer]|uniref:hypothetical protein n=1 Tax=unclassified Ensifer TaxID=2633371 RepID=UPI000813686E|nr:MULTISPECIES: hypothetical protein [unclassified Ensifer]OCP01760.1 hypothetical protein BC362_21320 [Ensifer sp. LC14]OCP09549.1 hypothetical protein BC374_03060 [Ensifer sp. LC13]OCP10719.1 hypothetical protein BBX50_03400 [Ensifer sp. LC11]OCP32797.1 hypothetical protein BC364_03060 [Ensifer sp. LC499]